MESFSEDVAERLFFYLSGFKFSLCGPLIWFLTWWQWWSEFLCDSRSQRGKDFSLFPALFGVSGYSCSRGFYESSVCVKVWFHICCIHWSVIFAFVCSPQSSFDVHLWTFLEKLLTDERNLHSIHSSQFRFSAVLTLNRSWIIEPSTLKLNLLVPVSGPKFSGRCCRKETG